MSMCSGVGDGPRLTVLAMQPIGFMKKMTQCCSNVKILKSVVPLPPAGSVHAESRERLFSSNPEGTEAPFVVRRKETKSKRPGTGRSVGGGSSCMLT